VKSSEQAGTKPEIWGLAEVADHLGVLRESVRRYYKRGDIPQPDGFLDGDRAPWWLAATITEHQRPGRLSGLKNQQADAK
jgi:hypothetical protein